jgi:NIMA-interacting peptidyl-prolyl cis-trans isomerase 4
MSFASSSLPARTCSHVLSTGGSLGWKTKGSLDPKFEEVAFQLPASPVATPTFGTVKTGFGYHIIMVEDRK